MKGLWIAVTMVISIAMACAPSANAINTAVAQTQAVKPMATRITPFPTFTIPPTHTYTPTITFTPTLSNTATVTNTATITFTPTTTLTPTVTLPSTPTLPANVISCIPRNTTRETGLVTEIIDGDTIDVRINNQVYRVRYIGIDTPERNDPFYSQATEYNQRLVSGQAVTLVKDISETDRFDRLLRYVMVGERFVNQELVEQGYALASTYPPDVACANIFVDAQRYAQTGKIGLWIPTSSPLIPSSGGDGGGGNCDPSYPGVCIPPRPPDLDCKDIPYKRFQVLAPDPHGFDGDDDGIGCES
jgi:micrococcal nuclease